MKRVILLFCAACMCAVLGLTACGSGYARIVGVEVGVVPQGASYIGDEELCDSDTLADNAYALNTQSEYDLLVGYIATGGSKYPIINSESVTFKYDSELFSITLIEEAASGEFVRYRLVCKEETVFSAILIEAGEHFDSVIISAKQSA